MRTIRFHEKEYELSGTVNVLSDRLSIVLLKGASTIDEILADIENASTITIYENGTVVGVHKDYNKLLAMTVMKSGVEADYKTKISIELKSEDTQTQLNRLHESVVALQEKQTQQSESINDIVTNVDSLSEVQNLSLEDLGSTLNQISETQTVLSQAIEDIGTTLDNLASSISTDTSNKGE